MDLKPVKSSNIKAIGHDEEKQELHVEFSGGGVYAYDGVSKELYDALMAATDSHGKFFAREIKKKFKFRKL